MQNILVDTVVPQAEAPQELQDSLQSYFKSGISPDDIEQVYRLKSAQPLLQGFTALFHGSFDGVLVRLLVLRELAAETASSSFTRADINARLAYLVPDSLETVLARLRAHHLLAWDGALGVYRVTPAARNILAAIDSLLLMGQDSDDADVGFLLSQVAGAQAVGGVTVEQLQHLLGRLVGLTEEFADAIASGSEFRLRSAQAKWHVACDWVEKGSQILHAITQDARADAATHRAAQAIGRAQSKLLNMQGMFSRALNQIERQRVHLGQSGLSTTDIKTWLMRHEDLAALADDALATPVSPLFITPAEMIDVAEAELFAGRAAAANDVLPAGEEARVEQSEEAGAPVELDAWLERLLAFAAPLSDAGASTLADAAPTAPPAAPVQHALLPASFAVASYRASLLPLLGDENAAALQGGAAAVARLPLAFCADDGMQALDDPEVAAISNSTLTVSSPTTTSPKRKHNMSDEAQILVARLLAQQTLKREDKLVKRALSDEQFRADVDGRLAACGLKLLDNVYADHVALALAREVEPKIFGARDAWQNNNVGLARDGVALLVVLWALIVLPKRERQESHQHAVEDQDDMFGQDKPLPRAQAASSGISFKALLADFGDKLGKKTRMSMNLGQLAKLGFVEVKGDAILEGPLLDLLMNTDLLKERIVNGALADIFKREAQDAAILAFPHAEQE